LKQISEDEMLRWVVCILTSLFLAAPASAENPWGPECASVEECIAHVQKMPQCSENDYQCFEAITEDGLTLEFEKFGRQAIPPLLQLVKTGNPTVASRAAEQLSVMTEFVHVGEAEVIFDAWRRKVPGSVFGATRLATPAFVREVMQEGSPPQ
jgi:hypothetical protein